MDNNQDLFEIAQISVARYINLMTQKHELELRNQELELHIRAIESFLTRACQKANYNWVTIDVDEIQNLLNGEEME